MNTILYTKRFFKITLLVMSLTAPTHTQIKTQTHSPPGSQLTFPDNLQHSLPLGVPEALLTGKETRIQVQSSIHENGSLVLPQPPVVKPFPVAPCVPLTVTLCGCDPRPPPSESTES